MPVYFRDTRSQGRKIRIAVLVESVEQASRLLHAGSPPRVSDEAAALAATRTDPGRVFWRLRETNCDETWYPSTKPPAEAPLPPHEQKERDYHTEREAERQRVRDASVIRVYAGGVPGHIDADAEAAVQQVHLTSVRGAVISIEWSEQHGGFLIRTVRAEQDNPDDTNHRDAAAHVKPEASNVVVIIPRPHDWEEAKRRAALRDLFAHRGSQRK